MKMHELKSQLKGLKNELSEILPDEFIDNVLESMGLQVRRSAFRGFATGTGIFLAGIVVGGAAALLLAPKPGIEMRSDIEDKIDNLVEKVKGIVARQTGEEETAGKTGAKQPGEKNTPASATRPGPNPVHS